MQRPELRFHSPTRSLTTDARELQELITACREGRLSDVAAWIEAGKPLQVGSVGHGRRPRATALAVAIETSQHDLVRLLLAAGYRPDLEPWSPFKRALRKRRWDLLELLLEAGADPSRVNPDVVFGTYTREIMERFWALGVDLARDGFMAEALATATRNRPLYGFVKNHTNDPRIQREVDVGLGYAIGLKNDKAISLCLWAGANPRNSVRVMSEGYIHPDDWTMTAFERTVWEGVPEYLRKLGFDPASDDLEALYELTYDAPAVEALAKIRPPKDWHPVTEKVLDFGLLRVGPELTSNWGLTWNLESVFRVGGHLRTLSDLTKRRLRKHLKRIDRYEARRLLRVLERHMDAAAFLDLIVHPIFVENCRDWGIKKRLIEEIADRKHGRGTAPAKARRILKAEKDRPPYFGLHPV